VARKAQLLSFLDRRNIHDPLSFALIPRNIEIFTIELLIFIILNDQINLRKKIRKNRIRTCSEYKNFNKVVLISFENAHLRDYIAIEFKFDCIIFIA